MKAFTHISTAQVREARAVLRNKEASKDQVKSASHMISLYEKQKTPEFRQNIAKDVAKQLRAASKELSEKLGLTITLTRVTTTPRGIIQIGMKAAPEGVAVKLRAEVVH